LPVKSSGAVIRKRDSVKFKTDTDVFIAVFLSKFCCGSWVSTIQFKKNQIFCIR